MDKQDMIKYLIFSVGILIILASALFIHNIESTVSIRCDGLPMYPNNDSDSIIHGQMKLDNAILVNLFNYNIEIHEPITGYSASFMMFEEPCIYSRYGEWEFR